MECITNAKALLEYHIASLKVNEYQHELMFIYSFCLSKEFDELQEKRLQVSEQYRTITSSQQGPGMNVTNNSMNYQTGRPQRFEFA